MSILQIGNFELATLFVRARTTTGREGGKTSFPRLRAYPYARTLQAGPLGIRHARRVSWESGAPEVARPCVVSETFLAGKPYWARQGCEGVVKSGPGEGGW
eukprot:scaffold1561_cov333-Pavlova_lutheri.AAC.3